MALLIGLLLLVLGSVTYYCWLPFTFQFLQGLTACSLLFWGAIAVVVGYSERKARRECHAALHDGVAGTPAGPASDATTEAELQPEPASIS